MSRRRHFAFAFAAAVVCLVACSARPSGTVLPGGDLGTNARLRANLAPVTPPPNGTKYYYRFATTSTTQSAGLADMQPDVDATGLVEAAWANSGAVYTLTLTVSPSPGPFEWQQAVPPFLQPGNYAFTATGGGLAESYSGYSYKGRAGIYLSIAQSSKNLPAAQIAIFPLVPTPARTSTVSVKNTSSYLSSQHADSWGSANATLDAVGSYASSQTDGHDNPRVVSTSRSTVATDATGELHACSQGLASSKQCTDRTWARPVKRNGAWVIAVASKVSVTRLGTTTVHRTLRYVPDWYPHVAPSSSLRTDTVTVTNATIPSGCATYAGQSAVAVVETISAIDPVAGTISASTSYAYYLPGNVMLACGISTQRVKRFANLTTGSLKQTTTTNTTVLMTTAPTPTPSPVPTATPFAVAGTLYAITNSNAGFALTGTLQSYTGFNQTPATTISGATSQINNPGAVAVGPGGNVFVVNDMNGNVCPCSITSYAAGQNGNTAPIGSYALSGISNAIAIDPSGNLYVPYNGSPGIEVLVPNGSGGYNDMRTLGNANPAQVTLDSNEAIYEAVTAGGYVAQFSPGTTGSPTAVATISGSSTTMDAPSGVAVDANGLIYVSQSAAAGVSIYSAGANGNVAPVRIIYGSATLLSSPSQLAIDGNGYLYVKDGENIRVFAAGASGNVAPLATWPISGLVSFTISPAPIGISPAGRPPHPHR